MAAGDPITRQFRDGNGTLFDLANVERVTDADELSGGVIYGPNGQMISTSNRFPVDLPSVPAGTNTIGGVTFPQPAATTTSVASAFGSSGTAAVAGYSSVTAMLSGTYAGVTAQLQGSNDGGTTWVGLKPLDVGSGLPVSDLTGLSSNTTYIWQADVAGLTHVRVGLGTYTSGTVNVRFQPSVAPTSAAALNGVTTGSLSAYGFTDGMVNPPRMMAYGALNQTFNGSTWDRLHGAWRTTTGDSGTKTATFAGATQTNFDSAGAYICIRLGTVSGTTPVLAAQLQWSPDAGTTWLSLGTVLPNLNASSQTGVILCAPTVHANLTGASPQVSNGLTVGSTVMVATNAFLPRTWRLNYTITGTTPSFAITAVDVNYVGSGL